jgi:hypothetical protein
MNLESVRQSSDSGWLYVDVTTTGEVNCHLCVSRADDTLVQAHRGPYRALKFCMINQIVVLQRLFDHCQMKIVDALKDGQIVQLVSAIAVDMDGLGGKPSSYRF